MSKLFGKAKFDRDLEALQEKSLLSPMSDSDDAEEYEWDLKKLSREDTPVPQFRDNVEVVKADPSLYFWISANVIASVSIIFINKSIFNDPSFKKLQFSFATFHFLCTFISLYIASSSSVGFFTRKKISASDILPLAFLMCVNIILQNVSLAFCSIIFFKIARVLLTPVTAIVNFGLHRIKIPRMAALTILPISFGVVLVCLDETAKKSSEKSTNFIGVISTLGGLLVSACYIVTVGATHKKLEVTSMQLLLKQSMVAPMILMYAVPWVDTFPDWNYVPTNKYILIALSGLCALVINLSNFNVINKGGATTCTIVAHVKTVTVLVLGWVFAGKEVGNNSVMGVFMVIGGIIVYTKAITNAKRQI